MTKNVSITIDIDVARIMLGVAGVKSNKIKEASDDDIFEKVLSLIGCYGATFKIEKE